MNPGYIIGSIAIAIFVGSFLFDRGYRRGYAKGIEDGRQLQAQESFDAGKLAADNWWLSAESGAEEERQKMWRRM